MRLSLHILAISSLLFGPLGFLLGSAILPIPSPSSPTSSSGLDQQLQCSSFSPLIPSENLSQNISIEVKKQK
jgi:hypothetical protein